MYLGWPLKARETAFEIRGGEGLKEIAGLLKEKKLIRSVFLFKLYTLLTGEAQYLKPGFYKLNGRYSPAAISSLLVRGPEDITVKIPEGTSLSGVEEILSSAEVVESGSLTGFPAKDLVSRYSFMENLDTAEGLLFPDTYALRKSSPPLEAMVKMIDRFREKIWPILEGKKDWYDILILASLLEREVPDFEERKIVAGILMKRLKLGMTLQVDAAVCYLKARNGRCYPLGKNDFAVDSLYNTYLYRGLPPAPIANPGLSAINAALNPAPSSYIYYLSDPKTGKTVFSETLEEHNENRRKYLNI